MIPDKFNSISDISRQRPVHGGAVCQAAQQYGIKPSDWLDLSTGINPNGWPVPEIPTAVFNRLPETDDGLIECAQHYYQNPHLTAVAGSQEAIQLIPKVLSELNLIPDRPRVGLITPAYAEHEFSWQQAKADIICLAPGTIEKHLPDLDILVLINPNNPSGHLYSPETLQLWQQQLNRHKGFMIIDEAFMDCTPQYSLLPHTDFTQADNLIVLRSVGKFFGLAGIRAGFMAAHPVILKTLEFFQGPWSVSHPARYILKQALNDQPWIAQNRQWLMQQSDRLETLLMDFIQNYDQQANVDGCPLFKTVFTNKAQDLFEHLAHQGILTRLLDNLSGIRFGLPGDSQQFERLGQAINYNSCDLIRPFIKGY